MKYNRGDANAKFVVTYKKGTSLHQNYYIVPLD